MNIKPGPYILILVVLVMLAYTCLKSHKDATLQKEQRRAEQQETATEISRLTKGEEIEVDGSAVAKIFKSSEIPALRQEGLITEEDAKKLEEGAKLRITLIPPEPSPEADTSEIEK